MKLVKFNIGYLNEGFYPHTILEGKSIIVTDAGELELFTDLGELVSLTGPRGCLWCLIGKTCT